ncbi:cyclodeaminase/cyclohydrolase family protein [Clostridium baratii]|uniref:cyclodeaminase/cyclohydrolase family protein n=1 Tax=Clostridium baratii TaxID=1561 RepID=UPI003D326A39
MNFKEYKIEGFLEDLASSSPAPGGGSTASLIAAISGCLNNMVYSLTIGKKAFEKLNDNEKEKMIALERECKIFIEKCMELMEEDRSSFNKLMECYKLPKTNEEEIDFRKSEIKNKIYEAMMAPLNVTRECFKFYDNIDFAVEFGNSMLISDAGVSASLLNAAIESSIINVKVNLNSLRDEIYAKEIEDEIKFIMEESLKRKNLILEKVNKCIYK